MKILAFILDKEVIERILHHLGEDTTPPRVLPARSPPQLEMPFAQTTGPVTWPVMAMCVQLASFVPYRLLFRHNSAPLARWETQRLRHPRRQDTMATDIDMWQQYVWGAS